jgi:hypothetical protein
MEGGYKPNDDTKAVIEGNMVINFTKEYALLQLNSC